MFMFDVFKAFGEMYPNLNDDRYLTKMIQFGSIFNTFSFAWTFFLDLKSVKFKHLFSVLLMLQIFCCFAINLLVTTRWSYALTIVFANLCMSGLFGLIHNETKIIFGETVGSPLYGLIFMGQIFTVVSTYALLQLLKTSKSYIDILYFCGSLSTFGLFILWFIFKEHKVMKKLK